ncbi:hypothetical protein GPECTOR_17g926 [Gonium pectorale]|uniref:Protein kinase domain-containing protein n=1 Tax=Gonium pectorale TaxID=33097 RepID=A0A150GKH3_GONPE|nr:hypothetical protein GPECTOR_17g926 [Gonium pectorale]|eukprot:KXZ50287.1 hypothetical protein GPECTOR_17g926 [Gonium pectorale]
MAADQVIFRQPHPHGLPADRYSHFIRPLGKGTFGELPSDPPWSADGSLSTHNAIGASQSGLASAANGSDGNGQPAGHGPLPPVAPKIEYEYVAVKLSKPLQEYSRPSLEYLRREVLCQRRLNHMHVVGFREVGITAHHRMYIALEFADSGNLRQWLDLRGGRLSEHEARWFFQQLVYGLAYCHAYGVYNRDIKPENLLLHRCGLPLPLLKVADFGLCKSSNDSIPNSCVGSPNYMAPEVFIQTVQEGGRAAGGLAYDGKKADVFSCGVVLYRMLFGCLPFNRAPGGRELHPTRDLRHIVDNMKHDRWRELLPPNPPQPPATAAAAAGMAAGAASAGATSGGACPDDSLLDLLGGMLRCNPKERMSLADVKRHPWYREGLSEDVYAMILSADAVPGPEATGSARSGAAANAGAVADSSGAQSIEVIEREFDRVLAAYDTHRREAARQAAEHDGDLDDEDGMCKDGTVG